MKVAEVRSEADARMRTYTVPSTRRDYTFRYFTEKEHWVSVEHVEDAAYFDDAEGFAVRWTPAGLIARAYQGAAGSVAEAFSRLDYRDKQELAKERGIKANQSEEELEAELEEAVEELARQVENQQ
ncbi:hypothetical protein DNAM5_113 [Haloarcula californiae tailed virus 1]|uniref:Uncharacterized protein n=1 Tax=Haloarcula californiae tailed virus 1 TaxID=1273746 RepID=R4TML1_9CAUD|nr:hypothetical protein M202_gp106 [Haloarcula californiae tailed virus 1]AGM11972.1 hypothetical protein DNAM5_113 [Haloarcula californiae tailed virus 1]UBF23100.1 hypothetical protein HCTV-16_gp117 [Haloarcula virus HCTV-16]